MIEKTLKTRLDTLMVSRGSAESRARAGALIMAGKVFVDGAMVDKPGRLIREDADILVKAAQMFVSRGGMKLDAALEAFGINPSGMSFLDAGASTGGFTHCLLLRNVARVAAVDVGYGQFDWTLRKDPRVTLFERTNIRLVDPKHLPFVPDGAVADMSFISLKLVLPRLKVLVKAGGPLITLVKPQFEVGRSEVGKGVVRDIGKIRGAIDAVKSFARSIELHVNGEMESPIRGPKGNREFFLHLTTPRE